MTDPEQTPVEAPAQADVPMEPLPITTTSNKRKASTESPPPGDGSAKRARHTSRSRSPPPTRGRSHSSDRSRHYSPSRSRSRSRSLSRSYSRSRSRSSFRSRSRSVRRRRSPTPPEIRTAREKIKREEQTRGKRLFGGLLNTLSGQSKRTKTVAEKKRSDIEARQQEKLRQQKKVLDKIKVDRANSLRRVRIREQIVFEEDVMLVRHQVLRSQAQCLKTRTTPVLLYRPWKLTRSQRDQIDDQLDAVEDQIEAELADFDKKYRDSVDRYGSPQRKVKNLDPLPPRRRPSRGYSRSRSRSRSRSYQLNRDRGRPDDRSRSRSRYSPSRSPQRFKTRSISRGSRRNDSPVRRDLDYGDETNKVVEDDSMVIDEPSGSAGMPVEPVKPIVGPVPDEADKGPSVKEDIVMADDNGSALTSAAKSTLDSVEESKPSVTVPEVSPEQPQETPKDHDEEIVLEAAEDTLIY